MAIGDLIKTNNDIVNVQNAISALQTFWAGHVPPQLISGSLPQPAEWIYDQNVADLAGELSSCAGGQPGISSFLTPCYNPINRAVAASSEVVANALAKEPAFYPGGESARLILLRAVSRSGDLASWTTHGDQLAQALANTIQLDPNVAVRLEALTAVGKASMPLSWAKTLNQAVQKTIASQPSWPWDADSRNALSIALSNVGASLTSRIADAARQQAMAAGAGLPVPVDPILPAGNPAGFPWMAVGVLGGAAFLVFGGVLLWRRRRS